MMRNLFIIQFALLFVSAINAQSFTSSNLPIVIINTDGSANIPNEPKIGANMKIIYHTDGTRNYLSDENNPLFLNYSGRIQIEIRGNSSSEFYTKQPYGLNTVNADNVTNNNVSILGMPKDNDWVLNSFAEDPSFSRDFLTYHLANNLGQYACRGKHCEVLLNGQYIGVYLFSEKIKVDANRVNITKMSSSDTFGQNLSGGYLIQCDRPTAGEQPAWQYPVVSIVNWVNFLHMSPKPNAITPSQHQYIRSQFDALVDASKNHNSSAADGYPSVIDMPSFIDFILLNELASNADAYQYSTYFHKDRNGKLRAGPVWDFNYAYGADAFGMRTHITGFQMTDGDNAGADFWRDLFNDPTFYCYFVKRWQEVTAANQPLSYSKISQTIDSLDALLTEARQREAIQYGTFDIQSYSADTLKNWISKRMTWLNQNLTSSGCSFPTVKPLVISKIHYNPLPSGTFTADQLEFIELTNNSNSPIDISGYYFKELGLTYIFPNNSIIPANGKIYLTSNAANFSSFYNTTSFGEYSRNLSNTSEKLVLVDAYGNVVDFVLYQNTAPWPAAANGTGAYLKLKDLNLDNSLASSWVAETNNTLNTEELEVNSANKIYPNPTNSQINIVNGEVILKYEIYDELGRLLMSESNLQSRHLIINLDDFAPNTYVIKTTISNQNVLFDKVVKF